jgi:hypothetical protein
MEENKEFTVTWVMQLEGTDPVDAAENALDIQRDADSIATVFQVTETNSSNTPYPATRFQLASDGGAVALDMRGMRVFKVLVNGTIIHYGRDGKEIVTTEVDLHEVHGLPLD